jgi:hypothetical protein
MTDRTPTPWEDLPKEVQDALIMQDEMLRAMFNWMGLMSMPYTPAEPSMEKCLAAARILQMHKAELEGRVVIDMVGVEYIFRYFDHYGKSLKTLVQHVETVETIISKIKR